MKFILKMRSYTGGENIVSCCLVVVEGSTRHGIMHGETNPKEAEEIKTLFQALGIEIEEETSPLPGVRL